MTRQPGDFGGLSEGYQTYRPDYPTALFEHALRLAGGVAGAMADIGAGTGISTRAWRQALGPGWTITGVEPNDEMRTRAMAATDPALTIDYVPGTAEVLPFADQSLDLVSAAQAAHWFDRPRFIAEAGRTLKAGGLLAFLNNNRDWRQDSFAASYEALIERAMPTYSRYYRSIDFLAEAGRALWADQVERHTVDWRRPMARADFVGLAFSSSNVRHAAEAMGRETFLAELNALITAALAPDGLIHLAYESEIVLARKRRLAILF
jgi:SAM-dependent methyltransferase